MKIIISENKENKLFQKLITESLIDYSNKVLIVQKYLNDNYLKIKSNYINNNGDVDEQFFVILLDKNKQPTDLKLTLNQLFYKIQYRFQNLLSDKNERDKLLKQIIIDWVNNKITKNGTLSKY